MFTKIALVYCYKCDSSESLCVVTAAPAGTCVHIAVSPQTDDFGFSNEGFP